MRSAFLVLVLPVLLHAGPRSTYFLGYHADTVRVIDSAEVMHNDDTVYTPHYDSTMTCLPDTCYWVHDTVWDTVYVPGWLGLRITLQIDVVYSLFDSQNDTFAIDVHAVAYDQNHWDTAYTHPTDSLWGELATRPAEDKRISLVVTDWADSLRNYHYVAVILAAYRISDPGVVACVTEVPAQVPRSLYPVHVALAAPEARRVDAASWRWTGVQLLNGRALTPGPSPARNVVADLAQRVLLQR